MAGIFDPQVSNTGAIAAQPLSPVVDNTALMEQRAQFNNFNKTVENVAKIGAGIVDIFASNQQAEAAAGDNEALNAFFTEQLDITNARESDPNFTLTKASIKRKESLQRFIANNPNLRDPAIKLFNQAQGKFDKEFTPEEKQAIEMKNEVLNSGWLDGTDPADEQALTTSYWRMKRASQVLRFDQANVTLENSKVGLDKNQLDLKNMQLTDEANTALLDHSYGMTERYQSSMKNVIDRYNNGELSKEEAEVLVRQMGINTKQAMRNVGQRADERYHTNNDRLIDFQQQLILDVLSGKPKTQAFEDQNNMILAYQSNRLLKDPVLAAAAATQKYIGYASIGNFPLVVNHTQKLMREGSSPQRDSENKRISTPPKMIGNSADDENIARTGYVAFNMDMLKAYNRGEMENDQEAQDLIFQNMENTLDSPDFWQNAIDNPNDFRQWNQLMSSPEFGDYVQKQNGLLDTAAQNASAIWKREYSDVVVPKIADQYKNQTFTVYRPQTIDPETRERTRESRETIAISDIAVPVYTGGAIQFVAKDTVDFRDQALVNEIDKNINTLNRRLSPHLTEMIRIQAHLSGNKNYEQQWNDAFAPMFMDEEETNNEQ